MRYVVKTKTKGLNLWDEMDRAFDSLWSSQNELSYTPKVDTYELKDAYVMEIEVPGFNQESVQIEVKDNLLSIKAQKPEEKDEDKTYLIKERQQGAISRSFYVPKDVEQAKISASYNNGILKLTLPKTPEAEPRQIKIN